MFFGPAKDSFRAIVGTAVIADGQVRHRCVWLNQSLASKAVLWDACGHRRHEFQDYQPYHR
jgi:hypothetical protein